MIISGLEKIGYEAVHNFESLSNTIRWKGIFNPQIFREKRWESKRNEDILDSKLARNCFIMQKNRL